ncbi:MAG: flavin reductase family protein [Bacteroidetes bacterium]|nr:flavin reductase family protein [Bacteroidota bacterium]
MKSIDPKDIPTGELFGLLTGAVTPRPIAFASTVDAEGNVNLSPFSFFNVFGANPPTFVFSPSRRVRDSTTKHTLDNILEVPEVVINLVNYAMVQQTSLASTEYDKGVNEFIKAGFTPVASDLVKPPRVAESPVAFECKVKQVIPCGNGGGSGNLIVCEGIRLHFKEEIFDATGQIDPIKMDAVARLGKNWYAHINEQSLFEVEKPVNKTGIGIDQIPAHIKNSSILSGNDLGKLGNIEQLPSAEEIRSYQENENGEINNIEDRHHLAKDLLKFNKVEEAWKVLLQQ